MRDWNARGLRRPYRCEVNSHVIHPIVHSKDDDVMTTALRLAIRERIDPVLEAMITIER